MSKTMRETPLWLGGGCSNKTIFSVCLAVVPNNLNGHLHGKRCDKLKYFQVNLPDYKHVETAGRKSNEFVQETLFFRGGKLN
jgi:hypothetical protein